MNVKVLPTFPCLVHGGMFLILREEMIQDPCVELPAKTKAAGPQPDFGSTVNKAQEMRKHPGNSKSKAQVKGN